MHINSEELLTYSEKPGKILYKEKCFCLPKNVDKKNLNCFLTALSMVMLKLDLG